MSRVFLSHSSRDSREAVAVKRWLIEQEPGLAEEIFLDLDPHTGIRPAERWKEALNKASTRCEAVICLLSKHWNRSHECAAEYRHAESLHKTILCARLEPVPDTRITSGWQRCDLSSGDVPGEQVSSGLHRTSHPLKLPKQVVHYSCVVVEAGVHIAERCITGRQVAGAHRGGCI